MPRKYSTEGTYINEKTAFITLLLLDGMQKKRKPYMDQHRIDETLHDLMPRMMPALRRRMNLWGKASVPNAAMQRNIPEIAPEAAELEMYPTDARLRQKAKEKKVFEETGEKYKPVQRKKKNVAGCG